MPRPIYKKTPTKVQYSVGWDARKRYKVTNVKVKSTVPWSQPSVLNYPANPLA